MESLQKFPRIDKYTKSLQNKGTQIFATLTDFNDFGTKRKPVKSFRGNLQKKIFRLSVCPQNAL